MMNLLRFSAGVFLALLMAGRASAQEDPRHWVPANSNAISVVRVGELLTSPYGKRQKWVDEYRDAYATGAVSAPPSVTEFIRATEYRPYARGEQPVYSIYTMRGPVQMNEIAKHELAKAEKLGDTFAVRSSRGMYFVRLGDRLLGGLQPADRQLLTRWSRLKASQGPTISDYLVAATALRSTEQVVVALDMSDMAQPEYLAQWAAASPSVKALGGDPQKVAEQFAELKGVRLAVSVTEEIESELRFDFAKPVTINPELLKAIVLEWLDVAGAYLPALAAADVKVERSSFMLEAKLEEQGFRRILSLIQTQHPVAALADPEELITQKPNAIASLRYYKGVVAAVLDLGYKNRKASDYEKTALWHENHAVRIENLSTRNVDPDLAAWGYDVAQKLRALAGSLRGVPVDVNKLERSIRYDVRSYDRRVATTEWGAFFRPEWLEVNTNLAEVRAAQRQAIAEDVTDREQIWAMLEADRQAIVKKMEDTYGVDFDAKK